VECVNDPRHGSGGLTRCTDQRDVGVKFRSDKSALRNPLKLQRNANGTFSLPLLNVRGVALARQAKLPSKFFKGPATAGAKF
jgi:hypothetical protein